MATQAERKALLFIGLVTLLGGVVRGWQALHPQQTTRGAVRNTGEHAASEDTSGDEREPSSRFASGHRTKDKHGHRLDSRSKSKPSIDSTSIIDLDRATVAQIEALGILKAGGARLIVANRDSFGPFGSLREVARVPYLTKGELRKLAPRVTFSLVPRPKNAVMRLGPEPAFPVAPPQLHGRTDPTPGRRKRRPLRDPLP